MQNLLQDWTQQSWKVSIRSITEGVSRKKEKLLQNTQLVKYYEQNDKIVKQIFELFPEASIINIIQIDKG